MNARGQSSAVAILSVVTHSIRKKLMVVVLATTAAALLLMGVAMMVFDLRTYHETWVKDLMAQAGLIGRASAPAIEFDDEKVAKENLDLLRIRARISEAAIYTSSGALFATYTRGDPAVARFPVMPESDGYHVEGPEIVVYKSIEKNNEKLGTVYLRADYELIRRLLSYLSILAAVTIISLVVATLMSAWLQGTLTAPILAMTGVAREVMTRRDFSLRVKKTTEDEIGYLVDAFNSMLAEIGKRAQAVEESNRTLEHEMGERRTAQDALVAADRRKDEFLATLAHELRNPLAPLRNALEIIRTTVNDPAAISMAREMMERQLRQLVHLVNDLLDVSRITTGKLVLKIAPVELQSILDSALETAAPLISARRHALIVHTPPAGIYVNADSTRLSQVLVNLLNNASKFTPEGGRITFDASVAELELIVKVSDNGVGIPVAMMPVIFNMFAQVDRSLEREQAGLGVGLSLARHLVEMHGGTINVVSGESGEGSTFTVRLPHIVDEMNGPPLTAEVATTPAVAKSHRVLLADDNIDFAESLAMILQVTGNEVRVVHDGVDALAAAVEFTPDFAFLDIGLPRLNGYELARKLRELPATRDSVLVAVTGWGQEDDKRRAREAGFDHHMVKPVEPDQILEVLATFKRS